MYPVSLTGMVPGLRPVQPGPVHGPQQKPKAYGDYYCSDCEVRWAKMEGHHCWSCGADLDPEEKE